MTQLFRLCVGALLLAGTTSCANAPVTQSSTDALPPRLAGTIEMTGGLIGVGVGYKWGHGTLNYQGRRLDFCIRGLSVGDVGATSLAAKGNVYNLESEEDFAGKYFAISGGFTVARGESLTLLKNKRGVTLELEAVETGLRFDMSASGVRIRMANTHGCKGQLTAPSPAPTSQAASEPAD